MVVLCCLQRLDAPEKAVTTLETGHTRELGYPIKQEFKRFAKYFQDVKTADMGAYDSDSSIT